MTLFLRTALSVKNEIDALKVIAAYIDLNRVWAGLVEGAEKYRWSDWGEAVAGVKEAVAGLSDVCGVRGGGLGESGGKVAYGSWVGESRKDEGEDKDARRSLLGRVRAFRPGVAVGSAGFVEDIFNNQRDQFVSKRKTETRHVDGEGGLY